MKYPMLTKILAEHRSQAASEIAEAGWKQNLMAVLISLFSIPSFAGTKDLHKALKGLDGLKVGEVKVQVKKNQSGQIDIKVGDFAIRGYAVGGTGNALVNLSIYGPKDKDVEELNGYEEAKFLMNKIVHSDELRK